MILGDAIHKVVAGPDFQKALVRMEISYDYKDRRQLEKKYRPNIVSLRRSSKRWT